MFLADIAEIKYYDRGFIQENSPDIFVFGDNMIRLGYGGQAKEARGEPNTVGIPTKWAPNNEPRSFFSDKDFKFVAPVIRGAFKTLSEYRTAGYSIYWPADGVGTGRARLKEKAPSIHSLIETLYTTLKRFR